MNERMVLQVLADVRQELDEVHAKMQDGDLSLVTACDLDAREVVLSWVEIALTVATA